MTMTYYYDRFRLEHYDLTRFPGPRPGERMPDFALVTPGGEPVRLSDYRGRWVVLESGSLTCNMYARHVRAMNAIRGRFPDVEFLLVYVREAHPGSRVPQHETLADKIENARALPAAYGENRPVLIDDMEGSVHRALGELPDMIYILDPDGTVIYRHDWTVPEEVEAVLNDRGRIYRNEHAFLPELGPHRWNTNRFMVKSMAKGGWNALWDFIRVMPRVIGEHIRADRAFRARRDDGNASADGGEKT